ncbi:hypothetical protein Q8A73_006897 [Channa argus]|nr:hypothetical protein Q8A73_006897 [Channa argus]
MIARIAQGCWLVILSTARWRSAAPETRRCAFFPSFLENINGKSEFACPAVCANGRTGKAGLAGGVGGSNPATHSSTSVSYISDRGPGFTQRRSGELIIRRPLGGGRAVPSESTIQQGSKVIQLANQGSVWVDWRRRRALPPFVLVRVGLLNKQLHFQPGFATAGSHTVLPQSQSH